MKYIRTKDGRIIDLERYENKTSPILKARGFITLIDKLKICDIEIYENDIINQADTIEELCDTIVIVWKDNLPTIWNDITHFKDLLSIYSSYQRKYKIVSIYGAIWTDKGLIYVAKMNDKGELELL